ncbi:hypothetical protein [Rhodococcus opacus]|uniref:hypothetical protein n=1 Tax=Rhodococcus opacus TaxID=37919 RepID=UPI001F5A31D6|nr:hypothetical protein [Rhodococcus opacus]UNN05230.1 hypothetical protein MOO23_40135 [Rhodococcus opacus]
MMNTRAPQVIVLEDHPALRTAFEAAVGAETLYWCSTVNEFRYVLDSGVIPDLAFLDFALDTAGLGIGGTFASETGTGFGALIELHRRFGPLNNMPKPRTIISTALNDQGRLLYAIAASHWFDADVVVDKQAVQAALIADIIAGSDPTPPNLKTNLRTNGYVLDDLFAATDWAAIWQVWAASAGRDEVAYARLNGTVAKNAIRKFRENMPERVQNLHDAFFLHEQWGKLDLAQIANEVSQPTVKDLIHNWIRKFEADEKRTKNVRYDYRPLLGLAHQHSAFFTAPELNAAVTVAEPWKRAQAPFPV